MTQAEAAVRLSNMLGETIYQQEISRWESGVQSSAKVLRAMVVIYGVSAGQLLAEVGPGKIK